MSGGPVIDGALAGFDGSVEILDRGHFRDDWQTAAFDERVLSRAPGLSIPVTDDWIEFQDGTGRVSRVQKWWAADPAGGGAWLWYGQLSRFRASDLRMSSVLRNVGDHGAQDWPISFDTLVEHYTAVERVLRPYGSPYGVHAAEYDRIECADYIERPSPTHFERSVIDRLAPAGMHPYVGQTVLGGRAWDIAPVSPMAPTDTARLHPLQFRRTWLHAIQDRRVVAGNARLSGRTVVACVLTEHGKVTGVEAVTEQPDGTVAVARIRAAAVVLACGALESARILLASDLPNRNGMLGRSFTLTQERVAYLLTDIPRSTDDADVRAGMFANVVVKDFYEPTESDAPVKCGKFALYDGYAAELPYRHVRNLGLTGEVLARFLAAERSRYAVKVSFKGESIPWGGKVVELGSTRNRFGLPVARVRYQPHPFDIAVSEYAERVIRRMAVALSAASVVIHPPPAGRHLISAHHHGGAVFGQSPDSSVLDANGECHEASGLFVADSSVMPTSGATNSTLTAMSLAHRLGRFLVTRRAGAPTPCAPIFDHASTEETS